MKNAEHLYYWWGISHQGVLVNGCDRARSKTVLKYTLLKENIFIRRIKKQSCGFLGIRQWFNSKQTAILLTQLAALLSTGTNLSHTIKILTENQNATNLSNLLTDLDRKLNQGKSFSQSLQNYPGLFDSVIIQILKGGELAGQIDTATVKASEYLELKTKAQNDLLTAILYPMMLSLISIAVLGIMILFVIPQFESIYAQSQNELPALTSNVLAISTFIRNHAMLCLSLICLTILTVYKLRNYFDLIRIIPKLNHIQKSIETLKIAQTLKELYQSGLPLTDALKICLDSSINPHCKKAISLTIEKLNQGHSLAFSLKQSGYFESLFIQLIQTGEESATLAQMLEHCVKFYQKQLQTTLARIRIILEPFLIVFLGSIIGIILIAMYLPIFNLGINF